MAQKVTEAQVREILEHRSDGIRTLPLRNNLVGISVKQIFAVANLAGSLTPEETATRVSLVEPGDGYMVMEHIMRYGTRPKEH